jgi:undecaprenyl diphosphate synthase
MLSASTSYRPETAGAMTTLSHIGLIPDGNRRWARANGVPLEEAYQRSMGVLATAIDMLFREVGELESIAVYMFSNENLGRSHGDLEAVLAAEAEFLRSQLPRLCEAHALNVAFPGLCDWAPFSTASTALSVAAHSAVQANSPNSVRWLYFVAGLDPLLDITRACRGGHPLEISQLSVPHRIDLVVRTASASRLSNFLPLQVAYSELVFLPVLFQDLMQTHLRQAILEYRRRTRTLGL